MATANKGIASWVDSKVRLFQGLYRRGTCAGFIHSTIIEVRGVENYPGVRLPMFEFIFWPLLKPWQYWNIGTLESSKGQVGLKIAPAR